MQASNNTPPIGSDRWRPKEKVRRRRCRNCNRLFWPETKWQRFDTDQCRTAFYKAFGPLDIERPREIKPKQKPHRRHCHNCNRLYWPETPWQRFDTEQCRKEFHHHGGAFGPLKIRLEKIIRVSIKELKVKIADLERRIVRLESR